MEYVFIDVREADEYKMGHILGSVNLPPSKLLSDCQELDSIPKDQQLVVYCHTGSRSNMAMYILQSKGYKNVINGINKEQVAVRYNVEIV